MKNKNTYILLLSIFAAICAWNVYHTVERIQLDNRLNDMPDSARTAWLENSANMDHYKTVVDRSLALGLDLQGGMFVTLEIGIDDVLRGLAGSAVDSTFERAIQAARRDQRTKPDHFVDLFYQNLKEISPRANLAGYFGGEFSELGYSAPDDAFIEKLKAEADDAVDRSVNVMRRRIDEFGVASPNIQKQDNGRIIVELPGVKDTDRIRDLLKRTAKLEFWQTYTLGAIYESVMKPINETVRDIEGIRSDSAAAADSLAEGDSARGTPDSAALASSDSAPRSTGAESVLGEESGEDPLAGDGDAGANQVDEFSSKNPFFSALAVPTQQGGNTPEIGYAEPADTGKINDWLKHPDVQSLIPNDLRFIWSAQPSDNIQDGNAYTLIAIKTNLDNEAPLTGDVVTDAAFELDQNKQVVVTMSMDATGTQVWSNMTKNNIGEYVAVVLDNKAYSYPRIQDRITTGNTQISGNFTVQEAKDLANILKAGKLPAPARIISEEIVGPSLGAQTVSRGFTSFLGGFLAVILFMVLYYRRVGLLADVVLLINLFFVVGIASALNVVLTLPGIAGIVLSMGMAVDANVLIYERVREEIENGKSIKGAINAGFHNAFSAIIDGNITTFLTGVILYSFGTGPIRGFAITLIIGIVTTLITALLITRMALIYLSDRPEAKQLEFGTTGVTGFFKRVKFRFIRSRSLAYTIGALLVAGSIGLMATQGFKLGIDFKGGRQYKVEFAEAPNPQAVTQSLTPKFEGQEPLVRTIGASDELLITTSYRVNDPEAEEQVQQRLKAGLGQHGEFKILQNSLVGPTIARDIKEGAVRAVIAAIIVIFLYIFLRFRRWQFGVGALISLTLNVLIVLGMFSLFGTLELLPFSMEIDQAIIAALLTIVGYTINDTVVVFDRIRETIREDRAGKPIGELFNVAINDTLSRTVVTSLTTLITALILFLFGGAALKGFMLALIVGILIGTLSSVFVASPIAMDLIRRLVKTTDPVLAGAATPSAAKRSKNS